MAEGTQPTPGEMTWTDLTVKDAAPLRDFYQAVVGWTCTPVDMGGYDDFCMNVPETGRTVAGICHARGANEGLPAQWLLYFTVSDLEASLANCERQGGHLLTEVRTMAGIGQYCVIEDPAGAVSALFQAF